MIPMVNMYLSWIIHRGLASGRLGSYSDASWRIIFGSCVDWRSDHE
jgi:hypothetical protein